MINRNNIKGILLPEIIIQNAIKGINMNKAKFKILSFLSLGKKYKKKMKK
jgi:hypothetical protein